MFIITWLFDKLGYIPKINVEVGALAAWPFPAAEEKKKPQVKKATTRAIKKPAVVAKTVAKKTTKAKAK